MTLDEALFNSSDTAPPEYGLAATYMIRLRGDVRGLLEARVDANKPSPDDWRTKWVYTSFGNDGTIETVASDDLGALLRRLGAVDLAAACDPANRNEPANLLPES